MSQFQSVIQRDNVPTEWCTGLVIRSTVISFLPWVHLSQVAPLLSSSNLSCASRCCPVLQVFGVYLRNLHFGKIRVETCTRFRTPRPDDECRSRSLGTFKDCYWIVSPEGEISTHPICNLYKKKLLWKAQLLGTRSIHKTLCFHPDPGLTF